MTGVDDREEGSFLSRWSRRKRAAARQDPLPETPDETAEAAAPAAPAEPEPLSEEALAALPRLEDLTETTDISGFLQPGVPAALKNAALRRVWMMSPAIRDYRDPAVDYAWDWNTPGGVPGDGCAPSADMAARMLKDLVAPRDVAEAPEPDAVESDAVASALPDNQSLSVKSEYKSLKIEQPADGVLSSSQSSGDAVEQEAVGSPPQNLQVTGNMKEIAADHGRVGLPLHQRRRHGGALPT